MPGGDRLLTIAGRLRHIRPHEILIFFTLAVLLALTLVAAAIITDEAASGAASGAASDVRSPAQG